MHISVFPIMILFTSYVASVVPEHVVYNTYTVCSMVEVAIDQESDTAYM